MFQGALGRLGSRIQAPEESLALQVFVDAGGRAAENRVWGGLAIVDDVEVAWLEKTILELRAKHVKLCLPTGELKGSALPDSEIRSLGWRMKDEDHRILFWANWYPAVEHPRMVALVKKTIDFLRTLRADPYRLDVGKIDDLYSRLAAFLEGLKGINRHKVISTVAHLGWLMGELERKALGPQLGAARIVLDREDIPLPRDCSEFLRLFIATSLQAAGMSRRLTWRALWMDGGSGAVTVSPEADSAHSAGLQMVDILLQGVQRGLPGYSGRTRRGINNVSSTSLPDS